MIKVSIMIPTYNAGNFLSRALESIPKREDLELLIIDDCSTDMSWDFLLNWKNNNINNFGNIILKHNDENMGCGFGKNWAYSIAQGEYIITLDSDDYYYTEVFNKCLDDLYNHNEDIIHIDNDVNSGDKWVDITKVATWSYFVRNDFLKKNNLNYDKEARRAGDWFLFEEIKKLNYTWHHMSRLAYHYNYPRKGSIVWEHAKWLKEHGEE